MARVNLSLLIISPQEQQLQIDRGGDRSLFIIHYSGQEGRSSKRRDGPGENTFEELDGMMSETMKQVGVAGEEEEMPIVNW